MTIARSEARVEAPPAAAFPASRVNGLEQVRGKLRDYLHLTKARLTSMVLLAAVVGYWLASVSIDVGALAWFSIGTFLVVGGANAYNQVLERDADARMGRTAQRPLPSGRLTVIQAAVAATVMSVAGLGILLARAGALTAMLAIVALATYVLVYTPMKPRTPFSTVPGAVAGAIPPLMGWSAAVGHLEPLAWCLFGILFFWQFPHTWAIAATYRSEYERVGYRSLGFEGESAWIIRAKTVLASLVLVAASVVPTVLGLAGWLYFGGAAALGLVVLGASTRFDGSERRRAVELMATTLFYLPLVLGLMALDGRMF